MKFIIWRYVWVFSDVIDVLGVLKFWFFKGFDSYVFLKMFGCEDLDEFYERNNFLRDVDDILILLLFLCSLDDFVYFKNFILYDLFKYYFNFFMFMLEIGGYCGFREKMILVLWVDKILLDYLEVILEFIIKGYRIDYYKSFVCLII